MAFCSRTAPFPPVWSLCPPHVAHSGIRRRPTPAPSSPLAGLHPFFRYSIFRETRSPSQTYTLQLLPRNDLGFYQELAWVCWDMKIYPSRKIAYSTASRCEAQGRLRTVHLPLVPLLPRQRLRPWTRRQEELFSQHHQPGGLHRPVGASPRRPEPALPGGAKPGPLPRPAPAAISRTPRSPLPSHRGGFARGSWARTLFCARDGSSGQRCSHSSAVTRSADARAPRESHPWYLRPAARG